MAPADKIRVALTGAADGASEAFFVKLAEQDRDVEIATSQRDTMQESLNGALEERAEFLDNTNIASFISKKVSAALKEACVEGGAIFKAADMDFPGGGIEKIKETVRKNYSERQFTMRTTSQLAQQGVTSIVGHRTRQYLYHREAINQVMRKKLEELGIKKDYIHTEMGYVSLDDKNPKFRIPCTQMVIDLPTDAIGALIDTEVKARLKSEDERIAEAKARAEPLGGDSQESKMTDGLRAHVEKRVRAQVMDDILGKALDIGPDWAQSAGAGRE